ncbi:hypothetical protein ACFXG4_04050 [Nocardia sp. NPDC059246]|uniref:hypothetical protein n=1 Tax=unclassified Nocardia TaxID=2637762 RepID=UPI003679010A
MEERSMNADQIRAEAIEIVANAIRAEHWCTENADFFGGYECCCGDSWGYPTFDGCQTRHHAAETAARYIDALGDLLPTGVETVTNPMSIRMWHQKRRYIGDWRDTPESDAA